jgi:hypothetical protein
MPQPIHSIDLLDGSNNAWTDRLVVGMQSGVANASGAAAAAVTTAVTFAYELPANYVPVVNPGQDATWYVTNKTSTGFNVVMTSRLAANGITAGTFDVVVFA